MHHDNRLWNCLCRVDFLDLLQGFKTVILMEIWTSEKLKEHFEKKAKKQRKHRESGIQKSCVAWFRSQYSVYGKLLFAIPNGVAVGGKKVTRNGKQIPVSALIAKGEGKLAGVADLFLSVPKWGKHGLYIEMKTKDGSLSKEQKEFRDAVLSQGYDWALCRSLDEFQRTINNYLIYT